jgi:hypothetical protein
MISLACLNFLVLGFLEQVSIMNQHDRDDAGLAQPPVASRSISAPPLCSG